MTSALMAREVVALDSERTRKKKEAPGIHAAENSAVRNPGARFLLRGSTTKNKNINQIRPALGWFFLAPGLGVEQQMIFINNELGNKIQSTFDHFSPTRSG